MRAPTIFCLVFFLALAPGGCSKEWSKYRNHSYYVSAKANLDFNQAQLFCKMHGGYLANIDDADEDNYLRTLAETKGQYTYFVGATDMLDEGTWLSVLTNKPMSYRGGWATGEPNYGRQGDCLAMEKVYGYKWKNVLCNYKEHYICEKDAIASIGCPENWVPFRDNCYFLSITTSPWAEAVQSCKKMGAFLTNIADADENNFLKKLAASKSYECPYVGASDAQKEGQWVAAENNLPVVYVGPWGPTEPNGGTTENCLCLHKIHAYQWTDVGCNLWLNYICKKTT